MSAEFEEFEKELKQNEPIAFSGQLEGFDPTAPRGSRYTIKVRRDTFARGEFVSKPPAAAQGKIVAYKWQQSQEGNWLFETTENAERRRVLSGLSPALKNAGAIARKIEKALTNTPRNNLIGNAAGVPSAGAVNQYRLSTPYKGNSNLNAYTATRANSGDFALLLANNRKWVAFGTGDNGSLRQRRNVERSTPRGDEEKVKILLYFDQNVFSPGRNDFFPEPSAYNLNNWFFEQIAQYFGADKFYFSTPYLGADYEENGQPLQLLVGFKNFLEGSGRTVAEVEGIPDDALDGVLVVSRPETTFPEELYNEFLQIQWNTYEELMTGAFPIFSWQGDGDYPAPLFFSGNDVSNLRQHAKRGGVLGIGEWMNEEAGSSWLPWNRALFGAFGYDSSEFAVLPYTLREFESAFYLNYLTANIADPRFGTEDRGLTFASTAAAYGNLPDGVRGIVRARPPGESRPSWYPQTSDDFFVGVEVYKLKTKIEL